MDADAELRKFKWLMLAAVLFCVSGCYSLAELNYLVRGETTEGRITEVLDTTRGRRRTPVRLVKFAYAEADGTRRSQDEVFAPDWRPPSDGALPVRYVPGSEYSGEIVGTARRWPLYVFGGSLALIAYFLWRLSKEANGPVRRRPIGGRSVRPGRR